MSADRTLNGCTERTLRAQQHDIHAGDVALINVIGLYSPDTTVPVVIQHHGDALSFDIYLHDGDDGFDRTVTIPIADLLAGWSP